MPVVSVRRFTPSGMVYKLILKLSTKKFDTIVKFVVRIYTMNEK